MPLRFFNPSSEPSLAPPGPATVRFPDAAPVPPVVGPETPPDGAEPPAILSLREHRERQLDTAYRRHMAEAGLDPDAEGGIL